MAAILALAWLCRNLIITRLQASVQHEFDQKLEGIRTDFRKSEESFKADLRAKENQIAALQSGALSGMVSRQAALDKRRLEAIDQLWAGVETLGPFKVATMWMRSINFEKALESVSENPEMRAFFSKLAPKLDSQNIPKVDVHKARPFVSEIAWALFSAYQAIVGYSTMQLHLLSMGPQLTSDILDHSHVSKLILAVLPHYGEYVEKHGTAGYAFILEPLEAALLKELQRMMRGEESDTQSIERAAKIMQEVRSVNEDIAKGSRVDSGNTEKSTDKYQEKHA